MAHDVYICYDESDREYCDAISNIFRENGIVSWVKSIDMSSQDPVDRITNAIEDSKCFILILSKNSRDENFVTTETDIAFSRDVPIILFNIDDSRIGKNIEFIFETQMVLSAFPEPKKQLKILVEETSKRIEKSSGNVRLDSKFVEPFDDINPYAGRLKIRKYAAIATVAVIVLALIYLFVIVPTGQHTTEDGAFSMNVTDVGVDGVKYTVYGESYNMPSDSVNYIMNIRFFDKNDNLVYEVNSTADEFKSGQIWSGNLHSDNATHIGFSLTDMNGKLLSKQDYVVK